MGLFSKEACAFCGKEVGALSRTKIAGGDYICTDCKYLTHPFIRKDKLNTEQTRALMEEMARDEEYFQSVVWSKPYNISAGGKRFIFYHNNETKEFALSTPETEKYKNHPVFSLYMVRPYDKNQEWFQQQDNSRPLPPLTREQYKEMITLQEKKGADGKLEGWVMYIPYFREHMNIEITFPGTANEKDVRGFYNGVRDTIAMANANANEQAVRNMKMQQTNAAQTASEMLKAAIRGEGTEGVAEKLKEGIETANDINEGKVKRGLFGRLKK